MKFGWLSATAGLLLTTTFAAAQTPRSSAIDNGDYSSAVVPAQAKVVVPPSAQVVEGTLPPPTSPTGIVMPVDHGEAFPPPYRIYGSSDFLVWKIKSGTIPGLVSTVPVGIITTNTLNTTQTPDGVTTGQSIAFQTFAPLTIQSSASLASGNKLDVGDQFGGRFTAGMWLDSDQSLGIEGSGFFITRKTAGFQSSVGGSADQSLISLPGSNNIFIVTPGTAPTAGLPVTTTTNSTITTVTTTTGGPTTTTTSNGSTSSTTTGTPGTPGTPSTSTLSQTFAAFAVRQAMSNIVDSGSTGMWGAELNARCTSPSLGAVSGIFGFRYLNFHEDLGIADSFQFFQPQGFQNLPNFSNFPTNFSYTTADMIRTSNQFYGGQLGVDLDMYIGNFTIDFVAKAALGVMHETVNVFGVNSNSLNGGAVMSGGLLSSAADQGNHTRDRIAFVPEINLKLGYQILSCLRFYVGYDCLYLSSVVRPGEQTGLSTTTIQANVGGTNSQITVNQPAFRLKANDLVVNGINFGMEFRY